MKEYFSAQPFIDEDDIRIVTEVLKSKHLEEGAYVKQFEETVRQKLDKKFAKATVNGFSSIHILLLSLGLKEGDEVIIPSYCCPAVLYPVKLTGATAVFADIAGNSFSMTVETINAVKTERTKLIIYPYQFGFPGEIDKVFEAFPDVYIIEDIAQSFGVRYKSKMLGSFTDYAIASFYASKMITAGDAGMALTNREDVSDSFNYYTYYGSRKGKQETGYNYHLTNMNAALGISQCSKLKFITEERKKLAGIYHRELQGLADLQVNFWGMEYASYLKYPVLCRDQKMRDHLNTALKKQKIHCGFGVLEALHVKEELELSFPNTEDFISRILCLPIYPSLIKEDVEYICSVLISELKK